MKISVSGRLLDFINAKTSSSSLSSWHGSLHLNESKYVDMETLMNVVANKMYTKRK